MPSAIFLALEAGDFTRTGRIYTNASKVLSPSC